MVMDVKGGVIEMRSNTSRRGGDFETLAAVSTGATSFQEDGCFMGRNVTYLRRKEGTKCWDNYGVSGKEVKRTNCKCQVWRDYDCDTGYVFNDNRSACIPDESTHVTHEKNRVCDKTTQKMRITKGYLMIPSDSCFDDGWGVKYVDCPDASGVPGGFFWTAFILAFGAIVIGCVGHHLYSTNATVRHSVDTVLERFPFKREAVETEGYEVIYQGEEGDEESEPDHVDESHGGPRQGPRGSGSAMFGVGVDDILGEDFPTSSPPTQFPKPSNNGDDEDERL